MSDPEYLKAFNAWKKGLADLGMEPTPVSAFSTGYSAGSQDRAALDAAERDVVKAAVAFATEDVVLSGSGRLLELIGCVDALIAVRAESGKEVKA